MGQGGCAQATGGWENWRWLFGFRPVKHKQALSPPGGGQGGALGNAVATLVTLTECLLLLSPSAPRHCELRRPSGCVLSLAAWIATRSKGEGGKAEESNSALHPGREGPAGPLPNKGRPGYGQTACGVCLPSPALAFCTAWMSSSCQASVFSSVNWTLTASSLGLLEYGERTER